MNRADIASGLFWLLFGLGVAYAGWDLELGVLSDPGSGFILFWVGLIMAALSLAVIVNGARARGAAGTAGAAWRDVRWPKVVWVLVALAAYGWALPRLGFILTTTLVMVFLFKVVESQRWWIAIGGAVASALVAYLVFRVWLGAQLPEGLFRLG